MRKMMMGWVVTSLVVTAVSAVPTDAQSQSSANIERAVGLESEAARFLDQPDRWAYAANLYWAAAQLRADEDPQGEEDLRIAANLAFETDNAAGAIAALELAASRVLASGDVVRAADIFSDAAWVASKAGRRVEQRRLTSRVAELADSSELSRSERDQIMSRFRGV